jgi:hypothetical protein
MSLSEPNQSTVNYCRDRVTAVGQSPKLLLGLVTHPHSRFNSGGKATNQVTELCDLVDGLDVSVEVLISDRNDFDQSTTRIGVVERFRSAWWQVKTEQDWANYLNAANGGKKESKLRDYAFYGGMLVKRAFLFLKSSVPLVRLANIDLSHLRVLRQGIQGNADWILILEDDASAQSLKDAAAKIADLLKSVEGQSVDCFVNLSESISHMDLGVERIVANAKVLQAFADGSELVEVTPPISNTVCANLYSRAFAFRFAEAIESQGVLPSVPIDWRLNRVVMDTAREGTTCMWVVPGFFVQGSMHAK